MKIIFHDNSLCLRGTTVAIYDYAYYCKHLYGIDCGIMYNETHFANHPYAISKFEKEFDFVKSYNHDNQMNELIRDFGADVFFMEKAGPWDGILSKHSKNFINACGLVNINQVYGDKFYMCSKWLSKYSNGIDYVPYMVNLPDINEDMRQDLGIPKDAVVIGRNGGNTTFDIEFAKYAVVESLKHRKDIWFLFQNTDKFCEHERVIWLEPTTDLEEKVKFINTCDCLLHARDIGEAFGQTCAEFSIKGKPVMTWFLSKERNHIDTLGDKGFYFNDFNDLVTLLINFEPNHSINYNCYEEYYPDVVMERFNKLYLES